MDLRIVHYLAFYLPQFHPIPENDSWWGQGFTEWTNVRKAKPKFRGHYQPHVPLDLGYYDLRSPEARIKQASLARQYGVSGFCYWHYWFGNGRRLLEFPAKEMLETGVPDFPFCFAWANQSWSGIWHGAPNNILMQQLYLGDDDDKNHFFEILPYLRDSRYFKWQSRPVFLIYRPHDHPNLQRFIYNWQRLAKQEKIERIFFLGITYKSEKPFDGLDGLVKHENYFQKESINLLDKVLFKTTGKYSDELLSELVYGCHRLSYSKMVNRTSNQILEDSIFPTIHTGWDNTPRAGRRGKVFYDFSTILFEKHLNKILKQIEFRNEALCFIKSWNEWAEGNYLEPDTKFRYSKLETFNKVLRKKGINSDYNY